MSAIALEKRKQSVSFKNEQLSCTFLKVDSINIDAINKEINSLTKKAPNLLHNLPLILDCNFKTKDHEMLAQFFINMKNLPLNIVGILENDVSKACLPPWPIINIYKQEKIDKIQDLKTIVYNRKVRSGDTVEANSAHLIVLGGVGSGAEVYATGNIFIFGTLEGKAFAGMNGAENAIITCQKLESELIAIAGIYSLYDDRDFSHNGNTSVYLENGTLNYRKIN